MNDWYKIAVVGLSPFDKGELTEKSRYVPQAGGESHTGILAPSDNSETHHPSDYFSESDKNYLIEKKMEEKRNKKKKNKKKNNKIVVKEQSSNEWYKTSQWGGSGPKIPTISPSSWVTDTFKDIKRKDVSQEETEAIHGDFKVTVSSDGSVGNGFFVNDNIVLTSSENAKNPNEIKITYDGQDYKGSVLTSNPQMGVAVIAVDDPGFTAETSARFSDSDTVVVGEKISAGNSSADVASLPDSQNQSIGFSSEENVPSGSPVLRDGEVIGMVSGPNVMIPINNIKKWLSENNINYNAG